MPIAISRPADEPIVVTILCYNTMEVPEATPPETAVEVETMDVALAVPDMENTYSLSGSVCKLSDLPAMLRKLTEEDVATVKRKIAEDPPYDPMVPNKRALTLAAAGK